jgi:LPXTG-motif cell wall-anchored protein
VTAVLGITVQTSSPAPVAVLGETVQTAGAELPRTGANLTTMVTLALGLIAAGALLLAGFRRRVGSASFPG